jgi:hypothetical protein
MLVNGRGHNDQGKMIAYSSGLCSLEVRGEVSVSESSYRQ